MTDNLSDLSARAAAAESRKDEVKRRLRCDFAAWRISGAEFEASGDRLVAECPVHEADGQAHEPSLHVWRDADHDRWRCSPCDRGGDVISLVQWLESLPFARALARCAELLAEQDAGGTGYQAPPPVERAVVAREALEEAARAMSDNLGWWPEARARVTELAASRGIQDAELLAREWGLGADDQVVSIPHRGWDGALTGYKLRRGDQKWAATGSRFQDLYGAWRDRGRTDVCLTEGETDTWAAWAMLPDRDALGLPSGVAGPRAEWLERLRGRRVWVMLDDDEASEPHARAWLAALGIDGVRVRPAEGCKDLAEHLLRGYGPGQLRAEDREAELPRIDVGESLTTQARLGWRAVAEANHPPHLFRWGGQPTRVAAGRIEVLDVPRLRAAADSAALWHRHTQTRGDVQVEPPRSTVETMLVEPNPPLPVLKRVVAAPVFRADGTIEAGEGYDPATQVWHQPAPGFRVPDPTEWPRVQDALQLLLGEWLGEFPFQGPAERAHALAFLLTPLLRELAPGPTPLFLFEKPAPRTGATLLASVLCIPALGSPPPVSPPATNDEEWQKRITALLLSGQAQVALLDNANELDSPSLSAAITGEEWAGRVLGSSRTVRVPLLTTWAATGNNPIMSREVSQRVVRVYLDAGVEDPTRREFRIPDLYAWTRARRADLLAAAYALVRHWIDAGRPAWRGRRLAGLENWSRTAGGVLLACGVEGFLDNLDEVRDSAASEEDQWLELVQLWHRQHGDSVVTANQLMLLAAAAGFAWRNTQQAGRALARMRNRVVGVHKIHRRPSASHPGYWLQDLTSPRQLAVSQKQEDFSDE